MADFALWMTACELAMWPAGTFWSAYCGNRDEAVEGAIDGDPIAAAVRAVMVTGTEWTGTAADLLGALAEEAGERVAKSKTWPVSPRALSGRLRRAATFLRRIGIEIAFEREGQARTRIIRITAASPLSSAEREGKFASVTSMSSVFTPKCNRINGFTASDEQAVGLAADAKADGRDGGTASTVRANPLKSSNKTATDGADAKIPAQSGPKKMAWTSRL
jgi:hypothetical protein